MSNCQNCYNGCVETTSDQCVKYTGVDIPELGIVKGDPLSLVLLQITNAINESSAFTPPYKVYTALLTQVGTSAPTAIVLENTIGNITLSRNSTGSYYINSPNLFTVDKTFTQITTILSGDMHYLITYSDVSRINVTTSNAATTFLDGKLDNSPIEIRVYN
jgi:hypothetical protein